MTDPAPSPGPPEPRPPEPGDLTPDGLAGLYCARAAAALRASAPQIEAEVGRGAFLLARPCFHVLCRPGVMRVLIRAGVEMALHDLRGLRPLAAWALGGLGTFPGGADPWPRGAAYLRAVESALATPASALSEAARAGLSCAAAGDEPGELP